jgi:hypothetical protein
MVKAYSRLLSSPVAMNDLVPPGTITGPPPGQVIV